MPHGIFDFASFEPSIGDASFDALRLNKKFKVIGTYYNYLRNAVAANADGWRWNGERRALQQDGGLRVRDVLVSMTARSVREQGCDRGLIKVFDKLGCS